jgi:hypothetical protein
LTAPTYSSNSASSYGGNYAAFAQKLSRLTDAQYSEHTGSRRNLISQNDTRKRTLTTSVSGTTSLTLSNQQSGGSIPTLHVALLDEFGQIVGSDSTST